MSQPRPRPFAVVDLVPAPEIAAAARGLRLVIAISRGEILHATA
jgi:hypothetical protein